MEIDPMKKSTKNTFKKIQEDIYIVMEFWLDESWIMMDWETRCHLAFGQHLGRLTWNLQITHEKKGTWSEPNLHEDMFHVILQGCKQKQKNISNQPDAPRDPHHWTPPRTVEPCVLLPSTPSFPRSMDSAACNFEGLLRWYEDSWTYDIWMQIHQNPWGSKDH